MEVNPEKLLEPERFSLTVQTDQKNRKGKFCFGVSGLKT
jgi:hypothetical protein